MHISNPAASIAAWGMLMAGGDPISVLVVDDHTACREGTARAVEGDHRLELHGTAVDGSEALAQIKARPPAIVVLDASMPKMNGGELLRVIRREGIELRVLVLTGHALPGPVHDVVVEGIDGYLSKEASYDQICDAIVSIVRGEKRHLAEQEAERAAMIAHARPRLSERQREVLVRFAEGRKVEEIADELSISESATKSCLREIRDKLNVPTSAAAVAMAFRTGLLE